MLSLKTNQSNGIGSNTNTFDSSLKGNGLLVKAFNFKLRSNEDLKDYSDAGMMIDQLQILHRTLQTGESLRAVESIFGGDITHATPLGPFNHDHAALASRFYNINHKKIIAIV
jgi:hypothetical protein